MRLRLFFRLIGPVSVALLAIGLLQWGLLPGALGHGSVWAAPARDAGKPVDPNAAAWRLWQDLDPTAQAKIDPRLIDEFQGEVIPAHLSNSLATGLPLARTRFLVYLTEQPDLVRLENQLVIAGAANPRRGTLDLLVQAAQTSQAPVRAVLDRQVADQAVDSYQPLFIVNAVAVEGDLMTVIDLARRDDVSHIAANYPLVPLWQDDASTGPNASPVTDTQSVTGPVAATVQSADLQTATVLEPANWNIDLVDADRVWTELGVTGQGAVVAGFDTGVYYAHPALINAYRGTLPAGQFDHNYNWFEPDSTLYADGNLGPSVSNQPYDCDYIGTHGTHTMGTMAGDGGDPGTQIGMAPGARWIAVPGICGNTMPGGLGDDIGGLKAFQWLLCPTDLSGELATADCSKAPHVVNNSWGSANPTNEVFRPAIQALRAAGIAPVFAAGNPATEPGSIGAPGNAPEAITVGATDQADQVSYFSGRGPSFYAGELKPELAAPGEAVKSSVANFVGDYDLNSGTSMAAPHVAGLVALLVSADLQDGIRDFDVDELERFMRLTALDLGEPGHDNDYGDGRINAFRAVQWALSAGDLTGTVQDADSGQPVQAQITGSNLREQTRFTTVANAAGFYSTTVPGGTYALSVTAWGYAGAVFTGQEVVETTLSVADFALEPLPTTRVTGQVLMPTGGVAGATVSVVGADVSTTTGDDGGFALNLPVGRHELAVRALGHRQTTINVDVAQGEGAAPLTVNMAAAPSILLVDADARLGWFYGWPVYNVMAQALEEQGYSYDLWRIRYPDRTDTFPLVDGRTGYGLPSDATLAQYDVVFWVHSACLSRVTGCIGGLGDDMVARLATYLDNGGRLVLSGQNIASFDDGTDFFDRYVRADLVYDAAATRDDTVIGWGFLQDVELPITNATLYGFRNGVFSLSPDSVAPQREWEYVGPAGETAPNPVSSETAVSYPILTYDRGAGAAAQATVSCANDSKLVFFALGYENVGPRGEERSPFIGATLHRTLTWLMTPQPAWNVVMVPNRLTQTATPGRRISYLLDLYNEGSTAASVQLALENNRWTSTLIVDDVALDAGASFTLPPCGHQEVRVQVDVPIGGPVEEVDALRILAQVDSAATATDSTAVTLTTTIQTNWRAEPSMPTARANSVAVAFPDAYHIVTMGGYTVQDSASGATAYPLSSVVEQFNVCTRTWTHWPDLPKPRTGAGAVALNGRIYLVGGTIGSPDLWGYSETATNEVTVYDPAEGAWRNVAPLPQNLTGVAVAVYDGKLYAFGGGRDYFYESNRTWVYDPAVDRWAELSPMPIAGTRYARAAAQNDKIYVVGGYYSSQSTLVYTPATDTWTQATAPEISRSNGAFVAAGDGYLYYIGGTVPADGSVERYDIQADTWTIIAPLSQGSSTHTGAFAAGSLYAIGGYDVNAATESLGLTNSFCRAGISTNRDAALAGGQVVQTINLIPDPQPLTNVEFYAPIPDHTTFAGFVGNEIGAVYDAAADQIEWRGDLDGNGQPRTVAFALDIAQASVGQWAPGATFTNTVRIVVPGFAGAAPNGQLIRTAVTPIIAPDFVVSTKSVAPPQAVSGDVLTYTIVVRSDTPAGDVVSVLDRLPTGIDYVPGSLTVPGGEGSYDPAQRAVQWNGALDSLDRAFVNASNDYVWSDSDRLGQGFDVPFQWIDIRTTGVNITDGDDIYRCGLNIGFPFPFYDQVETTFCASTNGFISFDEEGFASRSNGCFDGDTLGNDTTIAALWDDLDIDGGVYYQSFGQAPNRYLVVQWADARPFAVYNRGYSQFQLILEEGGGIRTNVLTAGGEDGARATTGLSDRTLGRSSVYACNTPRALHNNLSVLFLPPGNSDRQLDAQITFNARVTENVPVNTALTNRATISTGGTVFTRTATALINPVSLAESRLLTDRGDVTPRERVRYSLVLRNSGLRSAPDAQLTGELPAALRYVPDSLTCSGGACRMDGQTLDWRGAIAPTQAVTVTLEAVLETPLPDLTPVAWAVELADGFGNSYPLTATVQARRSNLAPTALDLRPAYVAPGQSSLLTARIFNAGRLPAAGRLTLELPPDLVFDPASVSCGSGVCGVDGRTLSWQGTLAARTLVLVRLTVRTPDDAVYGTMFEIGGRISDETWGDGYELTAKLVVSRNLFLPTVHGRDGSMEQQLYLPFVP